MSRPLKPRPGNKSRVPRSPIPSRRSPHRPRCDARQGDPSGAKPAPRAPVGAESGTAASALFSRARAWAKNSPDVRPEVVTRYKTLIAEGRYAPDLEKTAERMIREGLLEDLDA